MSLGLESYTSIELCLWNVGMLTSAESGRSGISSWTSTDDTRDWTSAPNSFDNWFWCDRRRPDKIICHRETEKDRSIWFKIITHIKDAIYSITKIWFYALYHWHWTSIDFSDHKVFRNMQKCGHCLNHLLPPRKDNDIKPRPVGHDSLLPICNYELNRRSFVVRCIFNFLTAWHACSP